MSLDLISGKDLLDRVNSEPNPNNWIVLSEWIGTLNLISGADAIVDWANAIYDRSKELSYWLEPKPQEGSEPIYDRSFFDDIVINRIEWDLSDLVESFDRYYPADRQSVIQVEDNESEPTVDNPIVNPLSVAHDENIDVWIGEIIELVKDRPQSLQNLSKKIPIVKVWLSALLSDSRIVMTRKSGDFYDLETILVQFNCFKNK
jgi:hypothetical protein